MPRKAVTVSDAEGFGQRIRELQKGGGRTQADLASWLGVERAVVGNYELGLHYPAIPQLVKLARVLKGARIVTAPPAAKGRTGTTG